MDHQAFRDTLEYRLGDELGFEVVDAATNGEGADRILADAGSNVVVWQPTLRAMSHRASIFESAAHRVLLLPGAACSDLMLGLALQVGVRGCVLTTESADALLEAIRRVADGEYVFPKSIRDRLTFNPKTQRFALSCPNGLSALTKRQLEVLRHLAEGRTNGQSAQLLQLSEKSIETHIYRMMCRLEIHNRVQLVRVAIREGLVNP